MKDNCGRDSKSHVLEHTMEYGDKKSLRTTL